MKKSLARLTALYGAVTVFAVAVFYGCTQPVEPIPIEVTQVAVVGSSTVTGKAGGTVTGLTVVVNDQQSNPMSGVAVSFSSSIGTVSPGSAQTGVDGKASIATWTMPTAKGTGTLTATASDKSAQFTVTILAGDPAKVEVSAANSNNQSSTAGAPVPNRPSVKVSDAFGNGVQNAAVTFAVASGGGQISGTATQATDANGVATVGGWTLGNTIGPNTLTATVGGTNITGNPLTFTATGTAGAPAALAVAPGSPSSDGQSAVAQTQVAVAPAVLVTDSHNNAVSGATVIMQVATGGGKVLQGTSPVDSAEFTTDANGIATASGWKLGSLGANTLSVSVKGTSVTSLTLTANGVAGNPKTVAVVTETPSSQAQSGTNNAALAVAPGVVVKDSLGNVVSGASVTFTVTGGGGKVLATPTDATGSTSLPFTSNSSGVARAGGWKLGNPGAQTMTAALTSNSSIAVTFTATSLTGPPASIAIVTETPSSNNQTTVAHVAVAVAPGVVVKDASGFLVSGQAVAFAVATGGGTVTSGATTGTSVSVNTDANGIARLTNWKPATVGANTMTATVTGITPTLAVTFSATGVTGPVRTLNQTNQPWGFVRQSTLVGGVPKVTVVDSGGNPLSGITVTWSSSNVATSTVGGTLTSLSDAQGVATFAGTWTAGTTLGSIGLVATVSSVSPSVTTTFTSKVVGAPTTAAANTGTNNQTGTVGAYVTVTPSITVTDGTNPVPGVSVTFANVTGSTTLTSRNSSQVNADGTTVTTQTDSMGVAGGVPGATSVTTGTCNFAFCFAGWKLGTTAGTSNNTMTATPTGLGAVTFTASGAAAAPASIAKTSGDGQTAAVNSSYSVSVTVKDQYLNVVPNASVTFAPQGTTNATATNPVTTNASGVATSTWKLDTIAGTNTLKASITSDATLFQTFTGTGTALSASKIVKNAGDAQTGQFVGTAAAVVPTVKVTDQYNNPVSASVTFSVGPNGSPAGSVGVASPTSSASTGLANPTSWTFGSLVGSQTLSAAITASPSVTTQFSAAVGCNDQNYTIGNTVTGSFVTADCTQDPSGNGTQTTFVHGKLITVTSGQVVFSDTLSGASIAPRLINMLWPPSTAYFYSNPASPVTNDYALGPGTYRIDLGTSTASQTGAYTFKTVTNGSNLTGCVFMQVTLGVTLSHSVDNSCATYTSSVDGNAHLSKAYQSYIPANTQMVIRMTSGAFSEQVEVYNASGGAFITSDKNTPGIVTVSAGSTGVFVTIRATSTTGASTGAFTISFKGS